MVWLVSICGAILALLLLLLCMLILIPWNITILVENKQVQIKAWKWCVYDSRRKRQLPRQDEAQKPDVIKIPTIDGIKKRLRQGKAQWEQERPNIQTILRRVNRIVRVKRMDLAVDYGFGDAAVTGMFHGLFWMLLSNATCFLCRYLDIRRVMNVALCPVYTASLFAVRVEIQCSFRPCRAIGVAWAIYKLQKRVKGGICYGTV